jgi:arginase
MGCTLREAGTVTASGPEMAPEGGSRTRYLDEITEVCRRAHGLVKGALGEGCRPLVLGGDHSLSIGTVSAVADHYRDQGQRVGLIWVDAHTDMNTPETTPSGNIHGMVLSVLTGHGPDPLLELGGSVPAISPENVTVLGARDIDLPEKERVKETGIRVITMSEIDERGIGPCMDEAMARAAKGTAGYHLSFDLDGIDPLEAPGVGTPVPGGLTYREAHLICEKAAGSGGILSLEVVELNPVLDVRNRTATLAVELVASALGKTIL